MSNPGNFSDKIVTNFPLIEIWNETGFLEAENLGLIEPAKLKRLVQNGLNRAVIAEAGLKLRWIEKDFYSFWKKEIWSHFYQQDKPYRENYPGEYFYFAYLWEIANSEKVVVLEKNH